MKFKLAVGLAVLMTFSFAAMAEDDTRLELKVRWWFSDFSAETSVVESIGGGDSDLDDELRVGDDDIAELWLKWRFSKNNSLDVRYTQFDNWGETIALDVFTINNVPVIPGASIRTDIELRYLRVGWRHMLYNGDQVNVETILDVALFDLDARYEARLGFLTPFLPRNSDSIDGIGGMPMIGLAADVDLLKRLNLYGEIAGMYVGDYGHVFDAEVGLEFSPSDNFAIEIGYRLFRVEVEIEDEDGHVDLRGPFVGVGLKF